MNEMIDNSGVTKGKYGSKDKELPVPYPVATMGELFVLDAERLVAKYQAEHQRKVAEKTAMVEEAVRTKMHLPDNYWKEEHMAKAKLDSAKRAFAALQELTPIVLPEVRKTYEEAHAK